MKTILLLILSCAAALGQQSKEPTAPAAVPTVAATDSYLFPTPLKVQLRDQQYQSDQLEIENQKLLLQIEKNHIQQRDLLDKMKTIAYEFATQSKIDLTLYELDPMDLKFVRKKK